MLEDLHDSGIVEINSLTSIGISDVPTEALNRFLDILMERIKAGIDGG